MTEIIDYKRKYKDMYLPKETPALIEIPAINFVAVSGKGNPNEAGGEYQRAVELLYPISYAIKMSKKGKEIPPGYFDFVVPPLESLWWLDNGSSWQVKEKFNWVAMIRLPGFVNQEIFDWACNEVAKKKRIDTDKARFYTYAEGLCVQCLHVGSYDDEPKTLAQIDLFISTNNLIQDLNDTRRHHEIYLSDPRKVEVSKMKTVLRIPVLKVEQDEKQ
jgi:hypothetical protein